MANLVNVGKYNMSVKQKEVLEDLGMSDEVVLDTLSPEEFGSFTSFGERYVRYVKKLREVYVPDSKDLLVNGGELWEEEAPPYIPSPDTFYQLPSGNFAVEVTIELNSTCANWLQSLSSRLPELFPNQPSRQNLGSVITPLLLDVMKNDHDRHSGMGTTRGEQSVSQLRPNG